MSNICDLYHTTVDEKTMDKSFVYTICFTSYYVYLEDAIQRMNMSDADTFDFKVTEIQAVHNTQPIDDWSESLAKLIVVTGCHVPEGKIPISHGNSQEVLKTACGISMLL